MVSGRSCVSCQTPIPGGALYCPSCGAATPTEISQETGTVREVESPARHGAEHSERVQRALGAGFGLGRLLGRGGFAEVYEATDLRLGRRVAVKVLRGDLLVSEALAERFRREAEAVAKLRHPNIVTIHQVGEGEGLSYYIMPLIEGGSLRERLEQGPMPIAEVRRILRETAGALATAHKAGLVHRDIKPDNIMLEGDEARVVVMDFGIAKALASGETGLTGTGMIVGTPHYMSPEQAMGSKDIDARSDIYSLGVVAYQMLSGRLPFEGDSAQEVLVQHITGKAAPVDTLRKDVPDDLLDAVERCLKKDAVDRYASAEELLRSLDVATPVQSALLTRKGLRAIRVRGRRVRLRRWHALAAAVLLLLASIAVFRRDLVYLAVDRWIGLYPGMEDQTAPSATSGWAALPRVAFVGMGDTALAVMKLGAAGPVLGIYDGRSWRSVSTRITTCGGSLISLVDTLLLLDGRGPCRSGGDWRREWVVRGDSLVPRTRLPVDAGVAWSDSRQVLIAGDGRMARRVPSGWEILPATRLLAFGSVFGIRGDRLWGLRQGWRGDSVYAFNGSAWRGFDPRPDTTVHWMLAAGQALPGGGAMVAGLECRHSDAGLCGPLLVRADSAGGAWRTVTRGLPAAFAPGGVWVSGDGSRVVVWGRAERIHLQGTGWRSEDVQPESLPSLLYEIEGDRVRAATELAGLRVLGVTSLRGRPHALLEDGTLWARTESEWAFVSVVPHSTLTGLPDAAASEDSAYVTATIGDSVFGGFREMWTGGGGGVVARRQRFGYPWPTRTGFARLLVQRDGLAVLTEGGELVSARCGDVLDVCTETVRRTPSGTRLRDARSLDGDTVLAAGDQGFVGFLAGDRWTRVPLPLGSERATVVRVARSGSGSLVALTDRVVLVRPPSGGWESFEVPSWLRPAGLLALLSDGTIAVASQTDIGYLVPRPGGSFAREETVRFGERITALLEVDGGRLLYATSTPNDPLLGGSVVLLLGGTGATGRGRRDLELPRRADVFALVGPQIDPPTVDGGRPRLTVRAVGSGWFYALLFVELP